MQNFGIFRTLAYSEPEAYSEPCQTSTIKQFGFIEISKNKLNKIE